MLFFKRKHGRERSFAEPKNVYEILSQAAEYLKDNPKVECNPYPAYEDCVMEALGTLELDQDYMKNHDEIGTKEIETLSLREIATMYTFIQRGERFCDGHIAAYIENGTIYKLILRHMELIGSSR